MHDVIIVLIQVVVNREGKKSAALQPRRGQSSVRYKPVRSIYMYVYITSGQEVSEEVLLSPLRLNVSE